MRCDHEFGHGLSGIARLWCERQSRRVTEAKTRTVAERAQRLADSDVGVFLRLVAGVCRKGLPRRLGSQWASHSGIEWTVVKGDVYCTAIKFVHL